MRKSTPRLFIALRGHMQGKGAFASGYVGHHGCFPRALAAVCGRCSHCGTYISLERCQYLTINAEAPEFLRILKQIKPWVASNFEKQVPVLGSQPEVIWAQQKGPEGSAVWGRRPRLKSLMEMPCDGCSVHPKVVSMWCGPARFPEASLLLWSRVSPRAGFPYPGWHRPQWFDSAQHTSLKNYLHKLCASYTREHIWQMNVPQSLWAEDRGPCRAGDTAHYRGRAPAEEAQHCECTGETGSVLSWVGESGQDGQRQFSGREQSTEHADGTVSLSPSSVTAHKRRAATEGCSCPVLLSAPPPGKEASRGHAFVPGNHRRLFQEATEE